jgi:hypothetical protein
MNQRTCNDPNALSLTQERMRLKIYARGMPDANGPDVLIGHNCWSALKADEADNTGHHQDRQPVLQGDMDKDITGEKNHFNFLPAVFPTAETGVEGKKIANMPGAKKLSHLLLMPWEHRDGVPLRQKQWFIYGGNKLRCQRHWGNRSNV